MTTPQTITPEGLLLPWPDDDGEPFWEFTRRGELRVQGCADCGLLRFPPRPCCPGCGSFDTAWRPMSGRGRLWSYVVAHPPLLPAYAERAPYPVVLVELEEDPRIRMVGTVTTSVRRPNAPWDAVSPQKLRIGMPVQAVFQAMSPEITVVRWAPSPTSIRA